MAKKINQAGLSLAIKKLNSQCHPCSGTGKVRKATCGICGGTGIKK